MGLKSEPGLQWSATGQFCSTGLFCWKSVLPGIFQQESKALLEPELKQTGNMLSVLKCSCFPTLRHKNKWTNILRVPIRYRDKCSCCSQFCVPCSWGLLWPSPWSRFNTALPYLVSFKIDVAVWVLNFFREGYIPLLAKYCMTFIYFIK